MPGNVRRGADCPLAKPRAVGCVVVRQSTHARAGAYRVAPAEVGLPLPRAWPFVAGPEAFATRSGSNPSAARSSSGWRAVLAVPSVPFHPRVDRRSRAGGAPIAPDPRPTSVDTRP